MEKLENQGIELPEDLNEIDKQLIVKQCELQKATKKEDIEGFAQAYKQAKDLALDEKKLESMSDEDILDLIFELAEKTDKVNEKGVRTVPVRFANMNQALPPDQIERALTVFSKFYAAGEFEPIEAYTEFEKIHPFVDGNGRVGDLLWKIAITRELGEWPEELPPDVFGSND